VYVKTRTDNFIVMCKQQVDTHDSITKLVFLSC